MNRLQDKWVNNKLIGLDIIFSRKSDIREISIDFIKNNTLSHSYGKEYHLTYNEKTTLNELLKKEDDLWSEIQINNKLFIDNKYIFLCGEGEMGNEGFIAKTDMNNNIMWFLYSTTSNPFISIKKEKNKIYFQSTLNFHIVLNLDNDSISISNVDI